MSKQNIDRSSIADARRFRWIVDGNGYYLEEAGLCGHGPGDEDEARQKIDDEIADEAVRKAQP